MGLLIGADLGGTKLSAVVCDNRGQVVHRAWQPHRVGDYPAALDTIETVVGQCVEFAAGRHDRIDGIGLAVAGWMSRDRAELIWGANIGSRGARLRDDLQARLGIPVAIENDGNATALAEYRLGAGRHSRSLALFTLGTGVGGGIVVDGELLLGGSGLAGELGHIPVFDESITCVCGGVGCVELYTSGPGLVRQYELESARTGGRTAVLTRSADVVAAAAGGEPTARAVIHRAGMALARSVQILIPITDPDLVLVGGTVGHAIGPLLLPIVAAELERRRPLRALGPTVRVAVAGLGPEAGALGAAEIVRDLLGKSANHPEPDSLVPKENHQ